MSASFFKVRGLTPVSSSEVTAGEIFLFFFYSWLPFFSMADIIILESVFPVLDR